MSTPAKPSSSVENLKAASNGLRGNLAEQLANSLSYFEEESVNLLKHHGMYQQTDRDLRKARNAQGNKLEKSYSLVVRVKIPGGRLTAEQFLTQLDLCDEIGNATARITDRQDLQLHGILKRNAREAVRRIHDAELTTLGACGDVQRNVVCCPAPYRNDVVRRHVQETAVRLSSHLMPRTPAYHEIWLTDPQTGQKERCGGSDGHAVEPFYGSTYLPRKFKTAIALAEDNCVDVYANDLGLVAIRSGAHLAGYNVLVGGGFGVTPSNKRTFPAVARRMAFVEPGDAIDLATAVVKVFRDFGDRSDRKRARLKYLIADWELDRFKAKVEEYFGRPLAGPEPQDVTGCENHLGWHEQGDGRWFYGLNIESGRILDRDGLRLKTALCEVCRTYRPGVSLTAHQSVLFSDIRSEDRAGLEAVLRRHGVRLSEDTSSLRRWSMACVALPTCGLAVAEAERVLPGVIDHLEQVFEQLGLPGERLTVRMTGCPNGCSRPYNADIGLAGKTAGKYTIYLGGRLLGDRLAFVFKDLVRLEDIVPALVPVLSRFKAERHDGETFGDFCYRIGVDGLQRVA